VVKQPYDKLIIRV